VAEVFLGQVGGLGAPRGRHVGVQAVYLLLDHLLFRHFPTQDGRIAACVELLFHLLDVHLTPLFEIQLFKHLSDLRCPASIRFIDQCVQKRLVLYT